MSTTSCKGALALCAALAGPCLADAPKPQEFAWRAALELPAATSGARVALPPEALLQLQSSDARDVRVFNAAGEAVAFGFAAPPAAAAAEQRTRRYNALPLYSAAPGARPARGAVQVRIDSTGAPGSVWVQMDGANGRTTAAAPGSTRLNAALFDTRQEKQPLRALELQAELPANVPVRISGATSADLAQWRPLELRGRIYRFDGPDGMANTTLELEQPLQLEGQYLRLGWEGQDGVAVNSVGGLVAAAAPVARVAAALPPPTVAGPTALEWPLAFATPVAALALSTTQANSLVPVRILGRNDAAQPWRTLASTVVYRLQGANGARETTNPAVPLGGATVRWLRVEATHGMQLAAGALRASVEFAPLQVVFVASGSPPFQLAAGRAGTDAAALPAGMLAGSLPVKLSELPEARVGAVQQREAAAAGPFASVFPQGPAGRSLLLWAVLGGGVLLLGGVAWALFRQLKAGTPPAA